jgi:hypothetical protein
MVKTFMQAPKGVTSANIEGHTYEVPASGKVEVVSPNHVETLQRHGFTDTDADEAPDFDAMDDKDELVSYIEERGGEADDSMSLKKLRRLAREAFDEAQGEEA